MNNQVAKTILAQLGGNKFLAMTGASKMVSSSDGLSFSIPRNYSRANRCIVTLCEGSDLYRVEFWCINSRTGDVAVLSTYEDVYCENLKEIFSSHTCLALSL